ncbi:hypothetical protein BGZ68_001761 [Mortierella alpina]|nr:hypothetical protein BGZ68_001761 [Mortierella alpina]
MAALSYCANTSQAAEALLNRARRLSSNAYERTLLPTAFAEGEDHRVLVPASASSLHYHHHSSFNSVILDPARRRSSNTQQRPRSATTAVSRSSLPPKPPAPSLPSTTITVSFTPLPVDASGSTADQNISGASDTPARSTPGSFLDPESAHISHGGLTEQTPPLEPSSSRPRALTLEGVHEVRDPQPDSSSETKETRRKHLSENGGSLVYDLLTVLRENTDMAVPRITRDDSSNVSSAPTSASASATSACSPLLIASEEKQYTEGESSNGLIAASISITAAGSDAVSEAHPESPRPLPAVISTQGSTVETQNTDAPLSATTGDETTEAFTPASPPSVALVEADVQLSPRPPSSASSRRSVGSEHEKRESFKEGKGAFFLHKMVRRKNSFTEGPSSSFTDDNDSTDTSNVRPLSTHLSASVPLSHSGSLTKRASKKILNKLVPKFLHTSSPHSTSELSPLSSRPSRSKSISGFGHIGSLYSSAIASTSSFSSSKGSQESLVLEATPEQEEQSIGDTGSRPPSSVARRLSCSSDASKVSGSSLASIPSGPPSSGNSADPADTESDAKPTVDGEDGEKDDTKDSAMIFDDGDNTALDDGTFDDPPLSPYVIDDNCDDAFFLNSVLRKRSYPSLNVGSAMGQQAVMSSSYHSHTTLSSMHSYASTPSISAGWSSASSSQASTPSPTSPSFLNGQIYPFPATTADMPTNLSYRTNPLPPPIKTGLDEKRNRLSEAVGEWRRSSIVSSATPI